MVVVGVVESTAGQEHHHNFVSSFLASDNQVKDEYEHSNYVNIAEKPNGYAKHQQSRKLSVITVNSGYFDKQSQKMRLRTQRRSLEPIQNNQAYERH